MTAHPSTSMLKAGTIKFDDVLFSVGINNLSAYKNTGKFICEKSGLYLISTSIYSMDNNAQYKIYLNDIEISYTRIGYNSNNPTMVHTGSVVVVLNLRLNDSLWVYNFGNFHVQGGKWSTLTIAKIK